MKRRNRKGCWLKDGGMHVSEGMDGWGMTGWGMTCLCLLMSICGWMGCIKMRGNN